MIILQKMHKLKTKENDYEKYEKIILPLLAVMALIPAGCGKSFDASGYVKALLDNSYKNDSAEFVAQGIGTKEEAEQVYNDGIQKEIDSLLLQADISDELAEEFSSVIKDAYKNVKYTVGEAAKQDDGSFTVEVKYQKMNIFAPAMEIFTTKTTEYMDEMTEKTANGEAAPSEAEIMEQSFTIMKDAIKDSMADVTYGDEETITVHVELNDNTYSVNEDDVVSLEQALFDYDAVQ